MDACVHVQPTRWHLQKQNWSRKKQTKPQQHSASLLLFLNGKKKRFSTLWVPILRAGLSLCSLLLCGSQTLSVQNINIMWVTRVLLYTSIRQPVFISVCFFFFICLLFKTISSLYIFYLSVLGSFSLYYGWKKTAEIAEKCSSCLIVRSAIS